MVTIRAEMWAGAVRCVSGGGGGGGKRSGLECGL